VVAVFRFPPQHTTTLVFRSLLVKETAAVLVQLARHLVLAAAVAAVLVLSALSVLARLAVLAVLDTMSRRLSLAVRFSRLVAVVVAARQAVLAVAASVVLVLLVQQVAQPHQRILLAVAAVLEVVVPAHRAATAVLASSMSGSRSNPRKQVSTWHISHE
jgi:hypothetical protein